MTEVLVSGRVYAHLAEAQQWIGYDVDAMSALADEMDVLPPEPEEPLYVFDKRDIRREEDGGRYAEILTATAYHQDPNETPIEVVPDHHEFVVTLRGADYSPPSLHQSAIDRLILPKQRREEQITRVSGWAILLGTLAIGLKGEASAEALAMSAALGMIFVGWSGPKPHIPDSVATMSSPLYLFDHQTKNA
jgi:hypothetical protein